MSSTQPNIIKVYSPSTNKAAAITTAASSASTSTSTTDSSSLSTNITIPSNAAASRMLVPAFLIPKPDGTSTIAHIVPTTQAGGTISSGSQTFQNLIINTGSRNAQGSSTLLGVLTPLGSGGQSAVKVVTTGAPAGAKISITPSASSTTKTTTTVPATNVLTFSRKVTKDSPAAQGNSIVQIAQQVMNQLSKISPGQQAKKMQPLAGGEMVDTAEKGKDASNATAKPSIEFKLPTGSVDPANVTYKKMSDGSYMAIVNEFPNLITFKGPTDTEANESVEGEEKKQEVSAGEKQNDEAKGIVLESDEKMEEMTELLEQDISEGAGQCDQTRQSQELKKDEAESENDSDDKGDKKTDEEKPKPPPRQFKRPSILGSRKTDKPTQAMLKEKLQEELRRMDAEEKIVEANKKRKQKFVRDKKTGAKIATKIDESLIKPAIEDFDPANLLEWRDGVGVLPGSNLKFRVNELGLMELVEESEDSDMELDTEDLLKKCENIPFIHNKTKSDADGETVPKKRSRKEKVSSLDTCCCEQCGCYGLASEFIKKRFCSSTCSDKFEKRKAAIRKKKEQEELEKLEKKRAEAAEVQLQMLDTSKWTFSAIGSEEGTSEALPCPDSPDPEETPTSDSVLGDSKPNTEPSSPAPSSSATPISDPEEDPRNNEGYPNDMPWINFNTDRTPNFLWPKYLEFTKTRAAPAKLFEEGGFPDRANGFKPGMKLEGIDPRIPSQFVVLSVVATKGFRVKLHMDGSNDANDYWVNADSKDIFPAGHCEKIGRKLTPPKAFAKKFTWAHYLKVTNAPLAPRNLFVHRQTSKNALGPSGFRVGMKLEALDKSNHELVCVATVTDILGGRILIHFDLWDDTYDYWADPSSPYIHPVGWCDSVGVELLPPKGMKDFSWDDYLQETKSQAVPIRAFKPKTCPGFKKGMKLECVDPRFPQLIRVGSILEVKNSRLHIGFDNWPLETSTWMDCDSPDIHPMGWCNKTGHPLGPPPVPGVEYQCYTQGCRALLKNSQFVLPHMGSCPLSTSNLAKARLCRYKDCKQKQLEEKVESKMEEEEEEEEMPEEDEATIENEDPQIEVPQIRRRKIRGIELVVTKPMSASVRSDVHDSVFRPGYAPSVKSMPVSRATHSKLVNWSSIDGKFDTKADSVKKWSPEKVSSFTEQVIGAKDKTKIFIDENINGNAFLMLSQSDLVDLLGFKIGQAVKIYNSILLLKEDK
ncbi:lethal(3)malignant brain tumor-like protein 3 [Neocloeon triangulifer]|uniref:lethal(3)malignant brain tumor-like protein 3 n=1 Tax=Neocloeon triangulifer TaxID=2078957 RepID=UPI00286EF41D|nr:lethal(3)malignant brain tumor-like protein 3 [Neocloeon triangulifer]XP_059475249.1 lethal(3)malignant brain tumor-like protein 3 [Neocloeon triangulifer]